MNTKIRFKQGEMFYNTIKEHVGTLSDVEQSQGSAYRDATVSSYISEMEFYRCFLFIKSALLRTVYSNVDRDDDILTPVNIEYLAAIMAKPLSFSMSVNSKNDVQSELAKELGRSPKSAYSAISRLKHAGYLVQTEDGLIEPMNDLQELRKVTKNHLATLGCFPVSYLLNIVVSNQIPDHDVQ